MNNFSGYQGLPNLSSIVADDLDISNLVVDTITVNTELKTNNIQPLANNDDVNIGTNGNTGQIINNQDTVVYNRFGVDTTYPLTSYDCQITANGVSIPAKIKLVNETSGEGCYIELNRGDYDFGADADRDWRLLNDLNGYFYLQSGESGVTKDYLTAGDDEIHITNNGGFFVDNTDLTIANGYGLYSNFLKSTSGVFNLQIGDTTYAAVGIIRFNQKVCIGTNTSTRQLNVSNEQDTTQNNYLLLLNTNSLSCSNGIQIRNQNGAVFSNEWYIYTPINSAELRYLGNGVDRFTFTNTGVLKLTTLTGTTTGTVFNLGESGDSGGITSNRSMTFASGKVINMPSNGPIYTLFVRNNPTTSAIQLYDTTTTGSCNFMTSSTTASLNILNGTTTGACNIYSNLYVGTNAVQKGIVCAYIQAYDPSNTVSLYPTNTTGIINFGQALTTGNINIHNTGGSGSINLNANTVLATGKSLTFSTTSDLKVNSIQPINVGDTTNIMTTSTAQINIGNPASISALYISNAISMASAKNIYLPNTNQRIECNNFESFSNPNPVEMYRSLTGTWKLGNSANTNKIEFYQDIDLSTSNKALYVNGISTIDPTQFLQIGQTTDTSYVQIERNTYIYTGKTLYSNTQKATDGVATAVSLYDDITTGSISLGTSQTSGSINIGNVSATTGKINLNNNTDIPATETLSLTTIAGNTVSSAVSLFNNLTTGSISLGTAQTSGSINISNVSSSGTINLNNNVVIPSTESLSVTTINSNGPSLALQIGTNITNNLIAIGTNINIGSIEIGKSTATNAPLNVNTNLVMASSKSITLDSSSKISTNNIESYATLALTIGNNITTLGNISIGTGLTTSNLVLAGAQTTGRVIIGNQSATPSSGNGQITAYNRIHNSYANGAFMFNVNSGTNLFNLTTGGALGGKQLTNTMYASAPTDNFNCIEGNSGAEGCAWLMNGDTSIIVNPGDQSAYWWLDEDSFTTANNWAWTGFKVSTTGVVTVSSDRRVKRDITPIVKENLLETLSKIQFVNYKKKAPTEEKYYKNGEFRRKYKEVHIGVIAQDVRQAGLQEVCERESEDAFWTVKYQDLGLYFNMGVQELIKENIALKERVSKLENFLKTKFEDFV